MLFASLPPMPIGGAEVQGLQLCKHLNKVGIETRVLTYGKLWHKWKGEYNGVKFTRLRSLINLITDIPSLFIRTVPISGVETRIIYNDKKQTHNEMSDKVGIGMILRYQTFYLNMLVYLWLKRRKFDIIHVHMMEWPALVAVKIGKVLNKPVLIKDSTMNGISNILRYPDGKHKQQEIAGYAYFVAMTRIIRENYMKAGISEQKITTIPNGIEVTPPPIKTALWSGKVIFVGNLTQQPAKGIDILLFAWKEVVQAFPTATLTIIGSGDLNAYRKFSEEQGIQSSVNFLGKQQQVRQLLLKSDIFVLPSRREGMSNALLEAMMCAMPIVATDVSGNQDLIKNNISGLVVPPANVERLAKAILQMLQHPEDAWTMGKAAYNTVINKCDMNKIADGYTQFYNKIMNQI